ncbi:MAG TPA: dTDP-4-dehydrorhamnose reductase [Candidatus Binatia bacterium]|nr:dTDP-4-dehydrorhamnose reductase [Candidatus Binatia bacterium]
MRLLVTGANGQVGWHLQRTLAPLGEVTALARDQLELADRDMVTRVVRELAPDILVNAAAHTAVDKAEGEPELAMTVNAAAPATMAQELAPRGALLVHYSTDYVFDGNKPGPYEEGDATGPLNVYGRSKLEGERRIAESGCPHIILRTSWVYDVRGKNFLRTVLRLAREREELRMVADQYGAPTWARSIAEATSIILARALEQRSATAAWRTGIFHLTAAGRTSWAEFAEAILKEYDECCSWPADTGEFSGLLKAKRVVPIGSDHYQAPARRPRNSVLSNALVASVFGVVMPDWRSQLRLAMQDAIR